MSISIADLTPEPGERVCTFGGSRAGKSSFMDWEMRYVQKHRPECMQILVDSKPRFRAETRVHPLRRKSRISAAKLYKAWDKGPVVPNSVVMNIWDPQPFKGLWPKSRPGEIVIMQGDDINAWRRMLFLLNAFTKAQIKGRERRMVVDEVLDFYGRNTLGIDTKNDVFYRAARAGGERKIGIELGAHRVHGIPPLILNMLSRVNLFHLRSDEDMKHLRVNVGIRDAASPVGDYVFRQYKVLPGGAVSDPITGLATYPESYLKQLSTS